MTKRGIFARLINLISLSTAESRIIVFTSSLILLVCLPLKYLDYLPIRSLYVTILGVSPYSTGITRGIANILHGNFYQGWQYNRLSILVLLVLVIILIKDILSIFKSRKFVL